MHATQDDPNRTTADADHEPLASAGAHSTQQMRAIVQDRYGTADVLELGQIERPTPAADEVLIEVHAAGVNRGTWHLVTGLPYLVRLAGYGMTRPKHRVPGADVAGRVVEVGAEVTRFAVGDAVFGIASGAFAEYAVASEAKLALKPADLTFEQAAVTTVSGITALQALTDVGDLQPGQRVLIIGASGGVGTYAVQLAKALGGIVTGVAGTRNQDLVASLGADEVIDYTRDDFTHRDDRYDLIIDTGGRNSIARLRSVLAPDGTLVIVGGEGGNRLTGGIGRQLRATVLSRFVGQRLTMFINTEHHTFIERLAEHIESGAVIPTIGRRFDLTDTADAIRTLETGATGGQSVIVVRGDEADDARAPDRR